MTRILVLALALLLFAHVARGSDYSVNCPEKIFTIQSVASEIPGWESTQVSEPASAVPNNYSSVGFYSGHPSGNALLRADSERGEFTLSVSSEIWMECRYENTIVTITARLPAGLKKCKINRQVTGRRTVFVASCRNA